MKKIFITGGAGYIGSMLVKQLLELGYKVMVYDKLIYTQTSLLSFFSNNRFKFIHGDVTDANKLIDTVSQFGPDVIIPLAALVGMPACDKNPTMAVAVNFNHVKTLVDNFPNKKFIVPNTNSQYGSSKEIVTEESPTKPLSLYSETKCDMEDYVINNTDGISLRLATVFGVSPRMRLDLLVNDFVFKSLRDKYLVLFEANFMRNYIHVRDVINVFILMIERYNDLKHNIFNVGMSNANLTKLELANKIKEYVHDLSITVDDYSTDVDKRNYLVSNDKLESTGWYPTYTIDDGIKELIAAYPIFNTILNKEFTNL